MRLRRRFFFPRGRATASAAAASAAAAAAASAASAAAASAAASAAAAVAATSSAWPAKPSRLPRRPPAECTVTKPRTASGDSCRQSVDPAVAEAHRQAWEAVPSVRGHEVVQALYCRT
jgi:hypothetical protein